MKHALFVFGEDHRTFSGKSLYLGIIRVAMQSFLHTIVFFNIRSGLIILLSVPSCVNVLIFCQLKFRYTGKNLGVYEVAINR